MSETTTDKALKLMESTDVSIIDVREDFEVADGTIPGAINIPLGELQTRVAQLDKNIKYIIICRSGSRSGMATHFLHSLGYNAMNMVGGMIEWQGEVVA